MIKPELTFFEVAFGLFPKIEPRAAVPVQYLLRGNVDVGFGAFHHERFGPRFLRFKVFENESL